MDDTAKRRHIRSHLQREQYAAEQVRQMQERDRITPALRYVGYDADSGRARVQVAGTSSEAPILLSVQTNGAIDRGSIVAGSVAAGAIDARPRPRREEAQTERRASSLPLALLFAAQTGDYLEQYGYDRGGIGVPKPKPLPQTTHFYLKLPKRTIDLGEYPGVVHPSSDGQRSQVVNLISVMRPQPAIVLQIVTSSVQEEVMDLGSGVGIATDYKADPLMLRSWIIDPIGRILAQAHQEWRSSRRYINTNFDVGANRIYNYWAYRVRSDQKLEYPSNLKRWREHLLQFELRDTTNDLIIDLIQQSWAIADPVSYAPLQYFKSGTELYPEEPDSPMLNFAVGKRSSAQRLRSITGDQEQTQTYTPSIASLYSPGAQQTIESTSVSEFADNPRSSSWKIDRNVTIAKSFWQDFPVLQNWGVTGETKSSVVNSTNFEFLTIDQVLSESTPRFNAPGWRSRVWQFDNLGEGFLGIDFPVRYLRLLAGAAIV